MRFDTEEKGTKYNEMMGIVFDLMVTTEESLPYVEGQEPYSESEYIRIRYVANDSIVSSWEPLKDLEANASKADFITFLALRGIEYAELRANSYPYANGKSQVLDFKTHTQFYIPDYYLWDKEGE